MSAAVSTAPTRHKHAKTIWRVATLVVLINLLIGSLIAWSLYQAYQYDKARASANASNVAKLLQQSVAETMNQLALHVDAVADELAHEKSTGGIDGEMLDRFLQRHHERAIDIASLRVANANGIITHESGKTLVAKANIRNTAYFQYHLHHQETRAYVSPPLREPSSGEWVLTLSKRVNRPDGQFDGIVLGSMALSQFSHMLSIVDIGQHGVISLCHNQFGLVVRRPNTPHQENAHSAHPPLHEFQERTSLPATVLATSSVDGLERIYAAQAIDAWPLSIFVGVAPKDYLAGWQQSLVKAALAMSLVILISVVLALFIYRECVKRLTLVKKLERKQQMLLSFAAMSVDWFWEQDSQFRFVDISPEVALKYGMSQENITGKTRWEIGFANSPEDWDAHRRTLAAHESFENFEYYLPNDKGERRYIHVSGEPVFDEAGHFQGYRGVGRDVTEKRLAEERIAQMAQYDNLTGLPNRVLFYDRFKQMISLAKREQREFALFYFDLDRFKPVNDTYGHATGDALLQMVASRLCTFLRESDTVARLGGDEFAALLLSVSSREEAQEVAQRTIAALSSPYSLPDMPEPVRIGVSVGIAFYPDDATTEASLINLADMAMYEAKTRGNDYAFADARGSGPDGDLAPEDVSA